MIHSTDFLVEFASRPRPPPLLRRHQAHSSLVSLAVFQRSSANQGITDLIETSFQSFPPSLLIPKHWISFRQSTKGLWNHTGKKRNTDNSQTPRQEHNTAQMKISYIHQQVSKSREPKWLLMTHDKGADVGRTEDVAVKSGMFPRSRRK